MIRNQSEEMIMSKQLKPRSIFALALQSRLFAKRVVAPKKGKGSYKRDKKVA